MRQFRDGKFVSADTLKFKWLGAACLCLGGQIGCRGRIVIEVEKLLSVLDESDNPEVQTETYSYHVSIQSSASLFRYDNSRQHTGHPDAHHKHIFAYGGHEQLPDSPVWIGAEKWPHLGDVIAEAQGWFWEHYETLDNRDDYAGNLRSGWGMS